MNVRTVGASLIGFVLPHKTLMEASFILLAWIVIEFSISDNGGQKFLRQVI